MSFASAMRGTQINQRYRQQADSLSNIDRDIRDDALATSDKMNKVGQGIGLFGDAVSLMGSASKGLTGFSENIATAQEQGLGFDLKNALMGKGGFYGEGINPMTLAQVGDTARLQELMGAYGLEGEFSDLANIKTSDNPYAGLLGYYNQQNKAKQKALEVATNQNISDTPISNTPASSANTVDYSEEIGESMTEEEWRQQQLRNQGYGSNIWMVGVR